MLRASFSLVVFGILAFMAVVHASFLTFQVEPKSVQCFFEDLAAGAPFDMSFDVTRGGLLDIKFQLFDPNRNLMQERMAFFNKPDEHLNEAEGRVNFKATTAGAYKFCFDNSMSRWTAKVISFEVRSRRANKAELAKLEHLGPMVDSVIRLSEDIDVIEKSQRTMRTREHQHFAVVRSTSSRLQWLVMIATVILVGIAVFSQQHVQKWFSNDQGSGL